MDRVTLHQLQCFDAVVSQGSFQAGAAKLGRTHSTVFTSIRNLEEQLGLRLFDRDGYRVSLTREGRAFHDRARVFLQDAALLRDHARKLATGEESDLRIVIGDMCPLPEVLGLLRRFFETCPSTRFHLLSEAISGPWERLFDDDAELIIHHIDKSDTRLDFIDLFSDEVLPVAAPGFLRFPPSREIAPQQLRDYVQCIVRDTARHSAPRDYYLVEGARTCTVSDQLMKKEFILQGMAWGHMPRFLVAEELNDGRLLSIAGRHLRGGTGEIVAARRSDRPHGPIAERLWRYIAAEAPKLRLTMRQRDHRTLVRKKSRVRRQASSPAA
jgi:DNA-binding transcriptional LysR family regulator